MFSAPFREGFDLRLLEERHAPALFKLVDQERVRLREWLPWVDATRTEDDTLSFIRSVLEQFASNHGFTTGVWNRDRLAGTVGLHRIDWLNRRVEIGYWLAREFQGRGVMTDACRAILKYVFYELELNRVEIRCAEGNAKSSAIPYRLGFTLDGQLRDAQVVNGRPHDLLVFGMLKRDWKP
jgi:ribosomal-protein-serine acetyltransferase